MITKKTAVQSKAKREPEKDDQVRIHNRFANRPLMFRIPGESVRLGPGESTTVSKACLISHELKGLCASGLILIEETGRRKPGKAKSSGPTPKTVPDEKKTSPAKQRARPSAKAFGKQRSPASKTGSRGTSGDDR